MRCWPSLVVVLAAAPLTAQEYRLPLEWRWFINASGGIAAGTGATFDAIDAALRAGGWSTLAGRCASLANCQSPSYYADDKQIPLTIAVRRAFGERAQARLFGSVVKPGSYAGTSGGYRVAVTPAVTVLALQAVAAVGPAWIGAGPSLNVARITSGSLAAPVTTREVKPGLAVGAGVAFPPHRPLWLEVAIERRFVGALEVPLVPVPGAPDIPAMDVPLSHTVISIGVGWRFP
jgi:hypothetical protein